MVKKFLCFILNLFSQSLPLTKIWRTHTISGLPPVFLIRYGQKAILEPGEAAHEKINMVYSGKSKPPTPKHRLTKRYVEQKDKVQLQALDRRSPWGQGRGKVGRL